MMKKIVKFTMKMKSKLIHLNNLIEITKKLTHLKNKTHYKVHLKL